MAYTTQPEELDTKRGLRAGLIGLAALAVAGVAAVGWSVAGYDSPTVPAVDIPTVDEMRAESMEIRQATAAGDAGSGVTDQERAEAAIAPALVPPSRIG